MLATLFEELRTNPVGFLGATRGQDFENRVSAGLDARAYNRILKSDLSHEEWNELRNGVEADSLAFSNTSTRRKHYVERPFGSQRYPDFLVLDGARVVLIEVKFSRKKQGHPMWNGGLPRQGGLYVFGAYGRQDVTFFLGRDVVSSEEARQLHNFFEKLTELQDAFNAKSMTGQRYGFTAYSRKAFDQRAKHSPNAVLDFFTNPGRCDLEDSALAFLQRRTDG